MINRRSMFKLAAASGCFGYPALARLPADGSAQPLATIPRSEQFDLKSAEGNVYRIRIGHPHAIEADLPLMIRGRKATAIYVLDGADTFGMTTDLTRYMQWGGDVPPCLTVAIGYPTDDPEELERRRSFDLTPTENPEHPRPGLRYGGSANFLSFLVQTLKPLIQEKYGVDPQESVLVGHSFGGLFTISSIAQAPNAFRHHLAMSPSLWYDHRFAVTRMDAALKAGLQPRGRLAIFVGEDEDLPHAMVANVLALKRLLDGRPGAFEALKIEVFPDADHFTVQGRALTEGLRFLLSKDISCYVPYKAIGEEP